MKVTVIGASGFVGGRLVPVLVERGHDVSALTRRPDEYRGPAEPRFADLDDLDSLLQALSGAQVVYLLAHSLGTDSFADREARQAGSLRDAAAEAGLDLIVFLGGLGRDGDDLSPHLQSRRRVEEILRSGSVQVTVVRSGIILGAGSAAWELLRQLVEVLPVTISDPRAGTLTQPIAVRDAVAYLADVIDHDSCRGLTLEIGGADVLAYHQMPERVAALTNRTRLRIRVPWLPNAVAAAGVELLTDVDGSTAQDLLGSMSTEAVVTDPKVHELLPRTVLGFDDAVRAAIAEGRPRSRRAATVSAARTLCSGRLLGWPIRKLRRRPG